LGKVEVELIRNAGLDQGAGVAPVQSDERIEKNEANSREFLQKALDGPDNAADTLPLLMDPAIAKDAKLPSGRPLRFQDGDGVEELRVNPPRSPVADDAVLQFYATADGFGIAQEAVGPPGDLLLPLVAFQHEVEEPGPRPKPVEVVEDGILAAKAEIEGLLPEDGKRPYGAGELEPRGGYAFRREKDEAVTPADERVAKLEVPAHASEYLDMGEQGRDVHGVLNLTRDRESVKAGTRRFCV
jgi:hypothetical protein